MSIISKFRNGYHRVFSASSSSSVLIYQMGKVGSSTLGESIPGATNMHTLYGNPPCKVLFDLERRGIWSVLGYFYDLLRQLAIKFRKEVKIITVIRDPIARNISMFFQDFPYWYIEYARRNRRVNRFSDDAVVEAIYEKVFPHDYVDTWFDREIKRLTGIDVYTDPYDKDEGYQSYVKGRYKLLLVEMHSIERNWSVIEDFVGRELSRINTNIGENKWYGPIYKLHKLRLSNNEEVNALVQGGKFYTKFYK